MIPSVTCLRLSDASVICRVRCYSFSVSNLRQTTTTDVSEQNNTGPLGGPVISKFTEFTKTTTVDDHDGISKQKHRLMLISTTFYNITLRPIIHDDWIPAPNELNNKTRTHQEMR